MNTYLLNIITDKINTKAARVIKFILYVLSFIYLAAVKIMTYCYAHKIFRKTKLACKVISVGNITLGGTGKTPLVELLAKRLKTEGKNVAILSRGWQAAKYGADEPMLYQNRIPDVPVIIGRNRAKSGIRAIREHASSTLILDDGFQHWVLYRDLDIVTIDTTNAFGNLQVLPRGILREPLIHLKRADIFVLTRADIGAANLAHLKEILSSINKNALIVESTHRPVSIYDTTAKETLKTSALKEAKVCLVAGIGNPRAFEQAAGYLGANIAEKFIFPDHYAYTEKDVNIIAAACRQKQIDKIITTEKDWMRMKGLTRSLAITVWVLQIELDITKNEKEFTERLLSIYSR